MVKCLVALGIFIGMSLAIESAHGQSSDVFFREDFNDLENWTPLHFPKIGKHTEYTIDREGESSYLKAGSNASASGIVFRRDFNPFEYPRVKWRWKVSNVYEKGNAKEKSGDDYPLRVYIIFKYDPDKASFGQKIKYGIAKKIYGEYPPHSSLNYIWANREHAESIMRNTYADEAIMILLQSGSKNVNRWIDEDVNIVDDYRSTFAADPPERASLAIMNDSDNTGESAVSYIDYIEVYGNCINGVKSCFLH